MHEFFYVGGAENFEFVAGPASFSSSGPECPDVQAGDLIIFFDAAGVTVQPTHAVPSGFTEIGRVVSGDAFWRWIVSYKIAAGTEGGTTITGMTTGGVRRPTLAVFRKQSPILSVSVHDVDTGTASASTGSSAANVPYVVIGCGAYFTSTTQPADATGTPAFDGSVDGQSNTRIGWNFTDPPVNQTVNEPSGNSYRATFAFYIEAT